MEVGAQRTEECSPPKGKGEYDVCSLEAESTSGVANEGARGFPEGGALAAAVGEVEVAVVPDVRPVEVAGYVVKGGILVLEDCKVVLD